MISKIHYFFKNEELPGYDSHVKMSPQGRNNPDFKIPDNARESAVLILLHKENEDTHCTLIQRPTYEGTHSGQIAFPGGKREEGEVLKTTALRETYEEIGVSPELINVFGKLSDIYIPPSNFIVSPFVGEIDFKPIYVPDDFEVDEVFSFALTELLNEDIMKSKRLKMANGMFLKINYFDINNKVVWGATAAILQELKDILKS